MDFDRPLDPPEDSIYVIYRIVHLDPRCTWGAHDTYDSEEEAEAAIAVILRARLENHRLLREAEADEDALENDEPVQIYTDDELLEDMREEYEIIEEEDEGDPDRDDWRYDA